MEHFFIIIIQITCLSRSNEKIAAPPARRPAGAPRAPGRLPRALRGRELISWGARAGLFQPGAVQTGQFTAAKRGPNYNRITDKYPPHQASGGRGGASFSARGQAGSRGSVLPGPPSLLRPCSRLPASCARSLQQEGGPREIVPIRAPVQKALPLPGEFSRV